MNGVAQVTSHHRGTTTVIFVDGEVDIVNAAYVQRRAMESISNDSTGVVLDLSSTSYIDSAGVSLAFQLARELGSRRQSFAIVAPHGSGVRRVLEVSGAANAFRIVASLDEATGLLTADGEPAS